MKKYIFYTVLTLCVLTFLSFTIHPLVVKASKDASTIIWTGSKITSSHTGNVSLKSGYLVLDHENIVGGNFIIDMTSITCTDIKSEKKNKYFVDHMKDRDFFDVARFPIAELDITNAKKISEQGFEMDGNMTIKGITLPIKFNSEIQIVGNSFTAISKIIIDRTKWGIEYKSGNIFKDLGDKAILDEIEFDIFLISEM
ncbi:MAG: YceI family protein [Flavobacteriales bacterium]